MVISRYERQREDCANCTCCRIDDCEAISNFEYIGLIMMLLTVFSYEVVELFTHYVSTEIQSQLSNHTKYFSLISIYMIAFVVFESSTCLFDCLKMRSCCCLTCSLEKSCTAVAFILFLIAMAICFIVSVGIRNLQMLVIVDWVYAGVSTGAISIWCFILFLVSCRAKANSDFKKDWLSLERPRVPIVMPEFLKTLISPFSFLFAYAFNSKKNKKKKPKKDQVNKEDGTQTTGLDNEEAGDEVNNQENPLNTDLEKANENEEEKEGDEETDSDNESTQSDQSTSSINTSDNVEKQHKTKGPAKPHYNEIMSVDEAFKTADDNIPLKLDENVKPKKKSKAMKVKKSGRKKLKNDDGQDPKKSVDKRKNDEKSFTKRLSKALTKESPNDSASDRSQDESPDERASLVENSVNKNKSFGSKLKQKLKIGKSEEEEVDGIIDLFSGI